MHGDHVIAYTIEDTIDVDAKKDLEYLEFYMDTIYGGPEIILKAQK